MALDPHVVENGLVGYQLEKNRLVLSRLDAPVYGNIRTGREDGVGWWVIIYFNQWKITGHRVFVVGKPG